MQYMFIYLYIAYTKYVWDYEYISVLSVWCFNHFPSFFMQHAFSIWLSYLLLLQEITYIAGAAAKFQCSGGIAAFNSIEPKLSHISALIMFLRISVSITYKTKTGKHHLHRPTVHLTQPSLQLSSISPRIPCALDLRSTYISLPQIQRKFARHSKHRGCVHWRTWS